MSKSIKAILYSSIAICLCAVLIVGATYALFTDSVTVKNHLSAGNLDVELYRVGYQKYSQDKTDGKMKLSEVNTTRVDLSVDDSVMFTAEKVVPGEWHEATMEISNNGTTAFDYGVKVVFDYAALTGKNKAFAEQVRITVTKSDNTTESFLLCNAATTEVVSGYILAGGEPHTFKVKAEFVNDTTEPNENNSAMSGAFDFDIQVFAIQKTA